MSLPQDAASSSPLPSALLSPDTTVRAGKMVDYELGGVALNDPSQGLRVRQWRVFEQGGSICVAPHPEGSPVSALFSADGVTEVSLAFDQLMHPAIAFVQAGVAKLYWYDTAVAGQVTTEFPGATSPMVCLDDKRDLQVTAGSSDVLLFYVLSGGVRYRQQRDRYTVERALAALPAGTTEITGVGMGMNGRVQVHMNAPPAVYRDAAGGSVYVATETGGVTQLEAGAGMAAVWRSKEVQLNEQPALAWARVEASGYPVTLLVQADSASKTVTVASDAPFRLPAVRGRAWQLEVRGSERVQAVVLASSREELEGVDADDLQI